MHAESVSADIAVRVASSGQISLPRAVTRWIEKCPAQSNSLSVRTYCSLQSMLDNPEREGMRAYWRSRFVSGLSAGSITSLLDAVAAAPSEQCMVMVEHYHGVYDRPSAPSAYPFRRGSLNVLVVGAWSEAEHTAEMRSRVRKWVRATVDGLGADVTGQAYTNYDADSVDGHPSVSDVQRLLTVVAQLDPGGRLA
jgi:hypothetical protein